MNKSIPEIDVRSQVARKSYAGELEFSFDAEDGLLDIPYVSFSSPVTARLRYEIFEDDAVEVKGTVCFSLKGECSRCLAPTEETFTHEAEALFLPTEPIGEEYGYSGGVVRLKEFLRDTVAFALPPRLLCETCKEE